jgi:hypothetical protein
VASHGLPSGLLALFSLWACYARSMVWRWVVHGSSIGWLCRIHRASMKIKTHDCKSQNEHHHCFAQLHGPNRLSLFCLCAHSQAVRCRLLGYPFHCVILGAETRDVHQRITHAFIRRTSSIETHVQFDSTRNRRACAAPGLLTLNGYAQSHLVHRPAPGDDAG